MFKVFRPTQEGSLCARFLAIKQEGSVANYNKKFVMFSAPLPHLTEEVLENTYLNGLRLPIRAEVIGRRPVGLEDIMEQAQMVEDRDLAVKLAEDEWNLGHTKGEPSKTQTKDWAKSGTKAHEGMKTIFIPDKTNPGTGRGYQDQRRDGPTRRLTNEEYKLKREKGLCFKCDEKFTIGHRCQRKEFRVLVVYEDREFEVEAEEDKDEPAELQLIEVTDLVKLSSKSDYNFSSPKTMKIQGENCGEPVLVLIDCGATHNFISVEVVEGLKLTISLTTEYGIMVGTEEEVRNQGICKDVVLELSGLQIT